MLSQRSASYKVEILRKLDNLGRRISRMKARGASEAPEKWTEYDRWVQRLEAKHRKVVSDLNQLDQADKADALALQARIRIGLTELRDRLLHASPSMI